tara:strand:+ start:88 stop:522 length:435 start_codon:yes stop_codon:yes gene_type:complete
MTIVNILYKKLKKKNINIDYEYNYDYNEDSYNPMVPEKLIEYDKLPNLHKKIVDTIFSNWECPICYDTINTKKIILCYPFECNHAYCFKCFKALCYSTPRRLRFKIKCPMCRQSTNNEWNEKYSVKCITAKINNKKYKVCIPID